MIRQPATGSRRPPAAMPVAVGLLILLAGGNLPASPTPSSLVEEASRSMQKARETGDPTWYVHARAAVDQALAMDASDYGALRANAWVLLGLHEFADARAAAEQALALEPDDFMNWANLTDALVELGDYPRAVDAADRLAGLHPGVVAYTRVAGLQALLGNRAEGIATLGQAVAAAEQGAPEGLAWTLVHLGHEHLALGDAAAASRAYERALAVFPDYHLALAGLARARAAEGRLSEAIALTARAAERVPTPAIYGALGDLHEAAGDAAEAERNWDLVRVMERLASAQGTTYGREVALFLADHDRDPAEALRLARTEAGRRDDVYTDDVLAWALAKNDRPAEAMRAAHRALRLGTEEAAFQYHAGMIARALGRPRAAERHLRRALALNPAFDVRQGPTARATLDALENPRLARADGREAR